MTRSSAAESQLLRANPYFLVNDVFTSAEYYRDVLGFHFHQFWGEPPSFVMVIRDGVQIMLCQSDDRRARNIVRPNRAVLPHSFDAYIYVKDADALHAEFESRGAKLLGEPQTQPHDCREFDVEDLNGYVLRFGQDMLANSSLKEST